jgi:DNA-binding Xre family transcriptional regulator
MAQILKEVIKLTGKTEVVLAKELGMSQQNLNKMKGNSNEDITVPLAIMIENDMKYSSFVFKYKGVDRIVSITIVG